MRLLKFLNEQTIDVNSILSDCKEYLEFRRTNNCRFYRGGFGKGKFKTSTRALKGTGENISKVVEDWFKSHSILDRKTSVVCTPSESVAKKFGKVHELFPIGHFDYSYCKSVDFNQNKASDPFQIVYFVWIFLQKNPNFYFWEDYVVNTLDLLKWVSFTLESENEQKAWQILLNNPHNYASSKEYNTLRNAFQRIISDLYMARISIDKLPKNAVIKFDQNQYEEWDPTSTPTITGNVFGEKKNFTVGELDKGVKSLPSLIKTNSGISDAAANSYEIWINPKEFYLVPLDIAKTI